MKIKKEFIKRNVVGECVVVPAANTALDFNGLITLNEVGEFLWDNLLEETNIDCLVSKVVNEYEIDKTTAKNDVLAFVTKLANAKIIE